MKKIIPLIAFLLLTHFANAQANIGARMGVNMGTFEFSNDRFTEGYDINRSFNVMINLDVDVPFSTVFSFRTGLGFVVKGAEFDSLQTMQHQFQDSAFSAVFNLNYLEIPLFLVARAETDFFGSFFLGAGPTLSLGVGGRMDVFSEDRVTGGQGPQPRYNINWGNNPASEGDFNPYGRLRRFDLGFGAVFSYQFPRRGLTLTVSYNRGLRNLSPNEGMNLNTNYLGFSIGFRMGG